MKYDPRKISVFLPLLLFAATSALSQVMDGFETGLSGWTISGSTVITRDSHAYRGKACVRIGEGYGSLAVRIDASPLSVVQYQVYFKSDREGVSGSASIRFYDSGNTQLLEYRNKLISSTTYRRTGDYTLTPPATRYVTISIEKDSSHEGYIYADDFSMEMVINNQARYPPRCNLDQYMYPFWNTDTIYNETLLMYSEGNRDASGKLLYDPVSILSVKSFDLNTSYRKGIDYTIKGNRITRLKNSGMPFRADTSFERNKNLAWYNLQSQWIAVTYTHKDKWSKPIPGYKGDQMPHFMKKLTAGMPLTLVAFGMSITRGFDVSGFDTVPPYMPTYVDLFVYQLKKKSGNNNIKLYNAGLPGATVDWGAQYAEKYINPLNPDLVIIDFGMNDFWRYTPQQFKEYVQTIMHKVKTGNPQPEFLLLSNMKFDPDYVLDTDSNKVSYLSNMEGYNVVLKELETTGVINLDMTSLSGLIYNLKKAKDCLANPLHPNDYLARWYAQAMVALFDNQKPPE